MNDSCNVIVESLRERVGMSYSPAFNLARATVEYLVYVLMYVCSYFPFLESY